MYVCLCRGITSKQIKEAAQKGARCNSDLNCFIGVAPDCGQCGAHTRQIIQQACATLANIPISADLTSLSAQ